MNIDDILDIQTILYENKRKNSGKMIKTERSNLLPTIGNIKENNNSYINTVEDEPLISKVNNDSIEDLGNLMKPKTQGKLLLFNKNKELLVTQRNESDSEYPMHYSLIDFVIDKENNNITVLLDQASRRNKIKITYGHHNNPQNIVEEKLYIVEFKTDIIYSDKKMKDVFWADANKLDDLRTDINYILTPLFKRLLLNYNPFYDSIKTIDKTVNLGDLDYYDANIDTNFMLYKPYSYMRSCEGKNIRKKLLDLCGCWFPIKRNVLDNLKEIIETIHCCTLMIDDIEDGSQLRRKCKCAHIVFGESLTINAAYMRIFNLLNNLGEDNIFSPSEILKVQSLIIKALTKLHEGQGGDIYWTTRKYCPTINQYLNMVEGKTGALFDLIPNLCLEFVNDKEDKQDKIILFFHLLAKFFQIRDDYINLTSFHYWQEKGLCSDIEEGKFTYPIILAMTDLMCYEELYEIMTSNERYEQKNKLRALDIMQRSGALSKTRSYLDELKTELIEVASNIDYNETVESIFILLDY